MELLFCLTCSTLESSPGSIPFLQDPSELNGAIETMNPATFGSLMMVLIIVIPLGFDFLFDLLCCRGEGREEEVSSFRGFHLAFPHYDICYATGQGSNDPTTKYVDPNYTFEE